ncbi:hypothetical protein MUJ63_02110 [Lachnospiraceae bacterium NSJ-143]|mgnify:CR=1 FL=1|nr:hypothetical protein [Lachnospiraceae bacterium NSJ-143]
MAVSKNKTAESAVDKTELSFSKEQILASRKFSDRKDILSTLLEDKRDYTETEINGIIDRFLKGKVN